MKKGLVLDRQDLSLVAESHVEDEGFDLSWGAWPGFDTNTQGRLVFQIMGAVAKFERDLSDPSRSSFQADCSWVKERQ